MTDETLTAEAILDALVTADRNLPRAALRQAIDRWPEISPHLLALLEAAANGTDRSDRAAAILSFGIYLMAQVCEPRAFRPLCALGTARDFLDRALGDGITEDLACILVRLFDGDQAPLRALVEAESADEFARSAALEALSWLTATGRIGRGETAGYLRGLFTDLQPQQPGQENVVWAAWQLAISCLGLEDLAPLVEQAFERRLIHPSFLALKDFQEDLRKALDATEPTSVFPPALEDIGRFGDVVALMSGWPWFQPQPAAPKKPREAQFVPSTAPARNKLRDVGRNDPCPCGSGKKFKKCCLGKTA